MRRALPWILPFSVYILLLALNPWMEDRVSGVIDPSWLYVGRAAAVVFLLAALWRNYPRTLWQGARGLGPWVLSVAAGVLVFVLWTLLDFGPFVIGEGSPWDASHAPSRWWVLAGSALVVPVFEEIFWRGFLMRWIHHPTFASVEPGEVSVKALLASSALFATEHRMWFAGLLAGLIYGELFRRTGDLRTAVLAHVVTNALLGLGLVGTAGGWLW